MFEWIFWSNAIQHVKQLPKEVVIGGIVYCVITDALGKAYKLRVAEITADAEVRNTELEVEKLRLQIELHELEAERAS